MVDYKAFRMLPDYLPGHPIRPPRTAVIGNHEDPHTHRGNGKDHKILLNAPIFAHESGDFPAGVGRIAAGRDACRDRPTKPTRR